ncbi:LacI family DNA-binding transcriptional regulator [Streptomyces sp. MPA0124]|uniref:LacI family DNA-binding transcriptional regulator n=1 Tax=Streptomyces sp. MPA0124 TaxID=3378069 RepID=UPI003852F3A7
MHGSGRVKIVDVTTAAGVGVTTVSHVISGRRPVSAATRARVEDAGAASATGPTRRRAACAPSAPTPSGSSPRTSPPVQHRASEASSPSLAPAAS